MIFDWSINLGQVLTAVAALGAALGFLLRLEHRLTSLEAKSDHNHECIESVKEAVIRMDEQVHNLANYVGRAVGLVRGGK